MVMPTVGANCPALIRCTRNTFIILALSSAGRFFQVRTDGAQRNCPRPTCHRYISRAEFTVAAYRGDSASDPIWPWPRRRY